jgi:RNA polymerase-binding transcription factor DksA
MSGYAGADIDAEAAAIFAENGIRAAQSLLHGSILSNCRDCGAPIPELRRAAAAKLQHKCDTCVPCQEVVDSQPRQKIKMLDRIL